MCVYEIWKGCPTMNKFPDLSSCNKQCQPKQPQTMEDWKNMVLATDPADLIAFHEILSGIFEQTPQFFKSYKPFNYHFLSKTCNCDYYLLFRIFCYDHGQIIFNNNDSLFQSYRILRSDSSHFSYDDTDKKIIRFNSICDYFHRTFNG
ncbi:hypothetical protein ACJJTC_008427 [Scirpophaga incertulas]